MELAVISNEEDYKGVLKAIDEDGKCKNKLSFVLFWACFLQNVI